jgi:hypothetical protein
MYRNVIFRSVDHAVRASLVLDFGSLPGKLLIIILIVVIFDLLRLLWGESILLRVK